MKSIMIVCVLCFSLIGCGVASKDKGEEPTRVVEETLDHQAIDQPTEVDERPPTSQEEEPVNGPSNLIVISGDVLNVRNSPSLVEGQKLGVVLEDSVYTILDHSLDEEDRLWYKINYDLESEGWIAAWYTESFDKPIEANLTDQQWGTYNGIHKVVTGGGIYKDPLSKASLKRQLIYDFDLDGQVDLVDFDLSYGETQPAVEGIYQCIINYDGQSLVFDYVENGEYGWGLTEYGVIDLDQSDQTVEFFIKEGQLSDRVVYAFYRIDQGELTYLTSTYGEILGHSGDGKVYYWGGQLIEPGYQEAFDPHMVISYYDMHLLDYVSTEQIVGKAWILKQEVILYKAKEDVIDGGPMEYSQLLELTETSRVALLEPGDRLEVEAIDTSTLRAQVTTSSDHKGWIGGFHMVWD